MLSLSSIYISNTFLIPLYSGEDSLPEETSLNKYSLHWTECKAAFFSLLLGWGCVCDSSSNREQLPSDSKRKQLMRTTEHRLAVYKFTANVVIVVVSPVVLLLVFFSRISKCLCSHSPGQRWQNEQSAFFFLAGGCFVGRLGEGFLIFLKLWLIGRGGEAAAVGWPSHSRLLQHAGGRWRSSTARRGDIGILAQLHQAALIFIPHVTDQENVKTFFDV